MMKIYQAGLDYSGAGVAFAVREKGAGTAVLDEFLPVDTRHSAEIPLQLSDLLSVRGLSFDSISEWSAGAGPGSFTGLRLAASFVMGLACGKNTVRTRCVSSASMIASCAACSGARAVVFFDGRKNELLACTLERDPRGFYRETSSPCVIRNPEDAAPLLEDHPCLAAAARDHNAVRAVLGGLFAESVHRLERLSALPLIQYDPDDFSRPLTDLLYLRPAVFVEPAKIRSVPVMAETEAQS